MSAEINDGYTLEATIPGRGVWPPLSIRYRPALPESVSEFMRSPKTGKQAFDAIVTFVRKHLVSWDATSQHTVDAKNRDDRSLDIGEKGEGIRRLSHPYIEGITEYVTGYNGDARESDEKNSHSESA